ncbi:MAG: hypothetical protein EAY75_16945 [Bacteroidetes bacterium]|nr:MAG: hypothetical protein EAY75_16945 [Bacteroidota bacterium]
MNIKLHPLIVVLLIGCSFYGNAAGVVSKREATIEKSVAFVLGLQNYVDEQAGTLTLKGLEAHLQRKLSLREKLAFRHYQKHGSNMAAAPLKMDDYDLKRKNKLLGALAMSFGIGGIILGFIPFASIVLLPLALVLGIISVSRANKFESKYKSGFGMGLAGLIMGGLGVLFVILALALLLSISFS